VPNPQPSVGCVLLNWNGWRDTVACLAALARLDYENVSVIVVDNGSADESVRRIREAAPGVLVLETGANLGFAGGSNVGIRHALAEGADYIWLLNNDTEPDPAALAQLVRKAESNARLGEVGSVLVYADEPSKIQAWGGGRVSFWSGTAVHALSPQEDQWFHYLTAASVLLRRRALEDVGLLDDRFFLYWEDSDLSFRLRKRAWALGVAAESIVLHKEHASTGGNRRVIDRYAVESGIRFLGKHARVPWFSVTSFVLLRIGKRLLTGQFRRIGDVTGGVKDYVFPPSQR
jgi:GT2 family glycosyltransferase